MHGLVGELGLRILPMTSSCQEPDKIKRPRLRQVQPWGDLRPPRDIHVGLCIDLDMDKSLEISRVERVCVELPRHLHCHCADMPHHQLVVVKSKIRRLWSACIGDISISSCLYRVSECLEMDAELRYLLNNRSGETE